MTHPAPQLYLPAPDRSFWQSPPDQDLDLLYLAWGHRDFEAEHIPPSTHQGWVTLLIEEGTPRIRIRDQIMTLFPGALQQIAPDCPFGWESTPGSSCSFLLWMWKEIPSSEIGSLAVSGHRGIRLPPSEWKTFQEIHRFCRQEIQCESGADPLALRGCRLMLSARLNRAFASRPASSPEEEKCQKALDWMDAHLGSHEPVSRLCDYLRTSQSSLHRLFRNHLRTSPASEFHRRKMAEATRRLRESDTPIKEIAFELGYEHFNDFSRAYKIHTGHSPSVIRCGRDAAQTR